MKSEGVTNTACTGPLLLLQRAPCQACFSTTAQIQMLELYLGFKQDPNRLRMSCKWSSRYAGTDRILYKKVLTKGNLYIVHRAEI